MKTEFEMTLFDDEETAKNLSILNRLEALFNHSKNILPLDYYWFSAVGAQPTVQVKSVQMGFDWDAGKFILIPEENLTPSDRDFAKQMTEMQERAGWADSENRRLKAEVKQLKKKITAGSGGKYSDIVSDGGMDPRGKE